jgi:hypothetical protein
LRCSIRKYQRGLLAAAGDALWLHRRRPVHLVRGSTYLGLPLWETFAASVNAEKYGHPVEHYAELTVEWILFGAVVGAVGGGVIAGWLLKRQTQGLAPHAVG